MFVGLSVDVPLRMGIHESLEVVTSALIVDQRLDDQVG